MPSTVSVVQRTAQKLVGTGADTYRNMKRKAKLNRHLSNKNIQVAST